MPHIDGGQHPISQYFILLVFLNMKACLEKNHEFWLFLKEQIRTADVSGSSFHMAKFLAKTKLQLCLFFIQIILTPIHHWPQLMFIFQSQSLSAYNKAGCPSPTGSVNGVN